LQGEGQEFESPRLHHPRLAPASIAIEQFGSIPETIGIVGDRARNEPLIRDLPERAEVTDQRIAGRRIGVSRTSGGLLEEAGRTLTTGYVSAD
jgi:hypothetical protein